MKTITIFSYQRIIPLLILFIISCTPGIPKPNNLIKKDKMAAVLADLAFYEQVRRKNPLPNPEGETASILKKHEVKAQDFYDSYTYYMYHRDIEDIYIKAQKKVKE